MLMLVVPFVLAVDLRRGTWQFEYTVVVGHDECFLRSVVARVPDALQRCRNQLTSRCVVAAHGR